MPGAAKGRPRHRQKRLTPRQAVRALYVDIESRAVEGEPPVLLGVLYAEEGNPASGEWVLRQFVLDGACGRTDVAAGSLCEVASISAALDEVLNRSDDERRHIVSWSVHDRDLIKELSAQRSFRYRNAIPIAKRWRRRLLQAGVIADDGGPNELRWYERLIGYKRPEERFEVGASIAYIRTRTGASPGAVERWMTVVEHNRHDLLAMREVAFRALGLHGFGSQGRQLEG